MTASTPWFDPSALMWMGPGLGILEALWGGVIGLLAYTLVRKGRGRPVVYGYLYTGLVAALGFLASGILAYLRGQPPAICASLLGAGGPLLVAALISLINVAKIYRLTDLRRMRAQDL